ncbi:MAG: PAS domain S-box protein, partial [Thermodesulfobacteriota bacterium]
TKQKRIEETLKESEKRFREIVELSADAIISCIDCKISLWNRAAEAMFGYTEEEVLGKGVEIIIPEQYRDAHRAAFEKAVETGEFRLAGEVVELEGLRKDGADFPVSLSLATSLHDKELYSTAIIRDITERRRAEETLRRMIEGTVAVAGEKFFDKLVESLSLALEVNIVFCAEYLDGRARTLAIRIGGECAENFEWPVAGTPCEEVLEGKIMFFAEEVQAQFPEDKWLAEVGAESYLGVPVTDSEGKVIGHMGVLDDKLMPGQSHIEPVIQIFAARAGAEIERMRINERLKQKLDEVERINKLMVGRELKMEEMRKEIGRLNKEIQDLRFKIQK